MDGFFSKASSFLNSQAEHEAPPPSSHGDSEETRKPASSGGYGDLLAGAQAMMNTAKPHDEDKSVGDEEKSHKVPSSGGYGDLLASAQSLMGSGKPNHAGESDKSPSSGGYGDLLASAQSLMGSTKLSGGHEGAPVDKKGALKTTSSGDSGYGDMYASAQVLMGAAKASREGGAAADMGEVAGATANLIGAATRYGNLEKSAYGEYAHKAQTYLHDYQTSHGKSGPQATHKPSSISEGKDEEESFSKAPLKPVNSEEDAPPRRRYAEGAQQDE